VDAAVLPAAEPAPAKINLALHVTGRRADGYHLLESLVVFAEFGDRLTVGPATHDRLSITGPQADSLTDDADNLVVRARELLRVRAEARSLIPPSGRGAGGPPPGGDTG
jgi:4-diphosphocytidyl-2-C-methyl-D-erythritol kinase